MREPCCITLRPRRCRRLEGAAVANSLWVDWRRQHCAMAAEDLPMSADFCRSYLYPKLGLKPSDHLPREGMPVREIDGVPVYVKPKTRLVVQRRVFAICRCGNHVTAAEFFVHQQQCRVAQNA